MGHAVGGCSLGGNWVPHVRQIQCSIMRFSFQGKNCSLCFRITQDILLMKNSAFASTTIAARRSQIMLPEETIPVRADEVFDVSAVERYLRSQLQGVGEGALIVRQFPAGASNLTYLLRMGTWEGVLRRPPLGPVPPKAHD